MKALTHLCGGELKRFQAAIDGEGGGDGQKDGLFIPNGGCKQMGVCGLHIQA